MDEIKIIINLIRQRGGHFPDYNSLYCTNNGMGHMRRQLYYLGEERDVIYQWGVFRNTPTCEVVTFDSFGISSTCRYKLDNGNLVTEHF